MQAKFNFRFSLYMYLVYTGSPQISYAVRSAAAFPFPLINNRDLR